MDRIVPLIAATLSVDPASLRDEDGVETVANWDSLRTLTIVSMIEITYGITLDNSELEQMTTVKRIREIVARHVQP